MGIGAGDIDVAVQIHPEGIHGVFPAADALHLVKEQVHPLARNHPVGNIAVKFLCSHVGKTNGFKVDLDDLLFFDAFGSKFIGHQLHQTGFSATADASDDLDHFRVPERLELFQIQGSFPKIRMQHMQSHLSK